MKERHHRTHHKPELEAASAEALSEAFSLEEIKAAIQKYKDRINELEDAKRDGTLSSHYRYSTDYMQLANDEVVALEEKIRELERGIKSKEKEEEDAEAVSAFQDEIEKRKARINELEKAKGKGTLSTHYKYSKDYMQLANDEVVQLEAEIHDLENRIRKIKGLDIEDADGGGGDDESKKDAKKGSADSVEDKEHGPETLAEMLARLAREKEEEEKLGPVLGPEPKPKDDDEELGPILGPEPKPVDDEEAPKPKGPKKLGIVKTDLVEKRSREEAAERMNRNKSELRGVSGFFKKIWTHNWMSEYYRTKEMQKVRDKLNEVGSVLGEADTAAEGDKHIKNAILQRFLHETPDLVHEAAGEWKDNIDAVSAEQRTAAENAIKLAVIGYASNPNVELAEGNLTEAINRVYANLFAASADGKGFEPLNIADNIKEYAREIRGQVEHGTALADLDLNFELTFGKAVTGARTEEAYTWRDQMIEKMAKSPIGRFVNETTIAGAVCAAASATQTLSRWSLRATVGWFGGGLLAGGALAGVRESQAIKRDRAEHARATASGRKFNEAESPRRKEINETTYSMLSTRHAIDNIRDMNKAGEGAEGLTEEQVVDMISFVASIDARVEISDIKKIDLLSYTNEREFEAERTELDIERAVAKAKAREAYTSLGLEEKFGSFDAFLSCQTAAAVRILYEGTSAAEGAEPGADNVLNEGINARDAAFESLRKRRVKGAFVKGMAVASVAGLIFHEAVHGVQHVTGYGGSGNAQVRGHPVAHSSGIVLTGSGSGSGMLTSGGTGSGAEIAGSTGGPGVAGGGGSYAQTKINGLLDYGPQTPVETVAVSGPEATSTIIVGGVPHEITSTVQSVLNVPEGFHVVPGNSPDSYNIYAGGHYDANGLLVDGKVVATGIEIDRGTVAHPGTWTLKPDSIQKLDAAGIKVGTHVEDITSAENYSTTQVKELSAEEYTAAHDNEFNRIHRLGWADNATKKPDLNELRLRDPELGADGKIHISIQNMSQKGSMLNGRHIDPRTMVREGKMELWVSASESTQFTPGHLVFEKDGTVAIDPESHIGKMFQFDDKGHVISRPRFTEAAAIMGEKEGIKEAIVCATDEGKDIAKIKDTVTVEGVRELLRAKVVTDLVYTQPEPEIVPVPDVPDPDVIVKPILEKQFVPEPEGHDWPIPIPFFVPRSPLERLTKEQVPPVVYYNLRASKERIKEWESKFSDSLRNNPKAKLNQTAELKKYLERQEKDGSLGKEYVKEIDDRIADGNLQSIITPKTKMIVCMPVHGPSESENIYHTLSLYAAQKDKGTLEETAVLLNINWREHEKDSELCKKTLAEVERAQKDFPELRLGYFKKEWSTEFIAQKSGLLSGSVQKHLFDTALRMIENSGTKQEMYLASNDADAQGMSGDYLKHLLEAEKENPEKDAFFGKIEWGSEEFVKYPGYHASMRVMQYLNMMKRNAKSMNEKNIESSGANFTCKASMYAAVGGFDSGTGAGADVDLGQRIRHARLGFNNEDTTDVEKLKSYPIGFVNKAWIDTDPARALGEYISGRPLANMWREWNKGGYKPRDTVAITNGTEESLEKFDEIAGRIQEQINGFLNNWGYGKAIYVKALNRMLPPRNGKVLWENNGTDDKPDIVLTALGRTWLKNQLIQFRDKDRANIKYEVAGGVR